MLLAIGGRVNGGLYGAYPSLTDLDHHGNLKAHVDFRSVYATMLETWLGAYATEVLGGEISGNLGFMQAPTDAPTDPGPGGSPVWPGPTYVWAAWSSFPPRADPSARHATRRADRLQRRQARHGCRADVAGGRRGRCARD